MADESYIQLAIEIAKKGAGSVSPNPLVGCVILKDNKIIGAGYHQKFGEEHAEINAINSSAEPVEGGILYLNLEPCSHYGKTPPCVDRIIKEKIKRVVIGTLDVNPLVSGNGVKALKKAGVDVKVGVLENECIELNKFFFKYITSKIPYVTLKAAQTLDGMIADKNKNSEWISSKESRKYVHWLRARYDAVLIGSDTARIDNPKLTVRMVEGRNPYRVVLDSKLNLKSDLYLFKNNSDKKTILITVEANKSKLNKINKFDKLGVNVLFVNSDRQGRIQLKSVLKELSKLQITSLLVEGGSKIYSSFIKQNLFDDIYLFVSPKILGSGLNTFSEFKSKKLGDAAKLNVKQTQKIGDDILIELVK
ncbi:MAG: bifunctional diaminohydroxyphosphoribosylaminopyrimidine deaminase/5-amino-6-(5-phosphoribosylamino)uracil reductase RibD [Ignavibacteriaceae bacterium]|nr:bifunctional diaminohydroxyphosphoribosylaminopyrimidine deaminase/5-amino-6-(5-phosphoribosylamino)uracil reductase RibD [Ignavibacteriaceae bacterium]HRP93398.1 bifunctional diaminohydroxyphosphoribosylaminopyrimidine deaminase/5-amino-6-(5-phosphoribosylamino)uracil reductase RibD [Ignavibacteriaceae bacterium]HRQ54545.1 bifunctional diaminohydroxyphosphoribosylaminopyrimidine deaminase/5-amino-6-(5-phosphoribosylamino)uracil reductase RibD [Ignavibacteriaceae bacterium]